MPQPMRYVVGREILLVQGVQIQQGPDISIYDQEMENRFNNGELFNKDSIKIKDTASFQTSLGRKVKGGGGIIPDVFVPLDTLLTNSFLIKIMQQNLLREFALDYYKKNKTARN